MVKCPLKVGTQITAEGKLMTIQFINFETCSFECIYYDICSGSFRSVEIVRHCLACHPELTLSCDTTAN